ncbi:hypothetical protein FB45DRAFT_906571 [Roridomyces roridus]|uniref:Uncharacterized protein n=1 Tax=Roridomyces roridus TaxID=1738132 RepID=A0AAD7FPM5_9AGAR|nr:hypothetical protein FB45DRAFT_906571 [Roridomyces roridus]
MSVYDHSPEAQYRWMATQNRVSNWVNGTPSMPSQYRNPFTPSSHSGSERKSPPSSSSSRRHTPTSNSNSRRSRPASGTRAPSSSGSYTPTVYPSDSISQAGSPYRAPSQPRRPSSNLSGSAHRSSHGSGRYISSSTDSSGRRTYIVQPPPATHQGMIIFPRRGKPPSVVYY